MSTTHFTIKGKTDGFGAQYQAMMSGIAYCAFTGKVYFHTPFLQMEHTTEVEKLNRFIGLNNDHLVANHQMPSEVDFVDSEAYCTIIHSSSTPSIYYTDAVLKLLRTAYYTTEKPDVGPIDIAIHIRRGDVTYDRNQYGYTEDSFYIQLIKAVQKKYPAYSITVFSEGAYEDFKELGLGESCFKLNQPVWEAFHSLVTAKVLVTAKSSFSYAAAILNEQTVYCMDCANKRLDHWNSVEDLFTP